MPPRPIQVKPQVKPESDHDSGDSSRSSPEPDIKKKKKKAKPKSKPKPSPVKTDGPILHRRSREGCYTCRVRRKKCDEVTPVCKACRNLQLKCEYDMPAWWQNLDLRKRHKERIKASIRTIKPHNAHSVTKKAPKPPNGTDTPPQSVCSSQHTAMLPSGSFSHSRKQSSDVFSPPFSVTTPHAYFDSTPMIPAPQWTPLPLQYPSFTPPSWEIDIKTERQIYIDDHPAWKESSISTFGTFQPATPSTAISSFPPNTWTKHDRFEMTTESFGEEPLEPSFFDFAHEPVSPDHQVVIQVEDRDRPLLNHFLDGVAPFIFSVFDARQKGSSLADVVLPQLENNPIYLHCCLSTAALHLKLTEHIEGEQIDNDIIRHRAATISSLCEAFSENNVEPSRLLEATLAIILFQNSVGSCDDGLPDIPWHAHFEAAHTLINDVQQQTPFSNGKIATHHAAFNVTMAYWMDILGSTALRRVPLFADTYRHKIETAEPSGLAELMGCDDRVMYLISEIACLDSLQETLNMDDVTLCSHIAGLGERISHTEFGPAEMATIYTPGSGAIRPRQLGRNITAIFRFAARIYLCCLLPDFDRHQPSIMGLVDSFTEAMNFIPPGQDGFDRALVWPLLVAGSVSVPASPFRKMFSRRSTELGKAAGFGSFGRLKELLGEVWQINDEHTAKGEKLGVNWRDVMQHHGLDYLII